MQRFAAVARELLAQCGARYESAPAQPVAGGSGTECYRWLGDGAPLFVKVAPRGQFALFEAEAAGLAELARARAVRVPEVRACGVADSLAFLALEWIEAGVRGPESAAQLGAQLAALHAVSAPRYGWNRDNSIGRTPQKNAWMEEWVSFFGERRLRPQLELAIERGCGALLAERAERLLESLPQLLAAHRPSASLLHGDLWGGNWLVSASGEPVIYDPAVYYGDRETDLAMTRLFGGFGNAFYAAYLAAAPLPPGADTRVTLYNLYHVLNHANLFGGSYAQQGRAMIERLLAEVRT